DRDLELKRAGYLAETGTVRAEAAQAGPLAEARAAQEVAGQQMALAQRQAEVAALRLDTEVRQAADAEAYQRRAPPAARPDPGQAAPARGGVRDDPHPRGETPGRKDRRGAAPAGRRPGSGAARPAAPAPHGRGPGHRAVGRPPWLTRRPGWRPRRTARP